MTSLSIDAASCRVECPKCGKSVEDMDYGMEYDSFPDEIVFEAKCEHCLAFVGVSFDIAPPEVKVFEEG
jgi:hypothetical protein